MLTRRRSASILWGLVLALVSSPLALAQWTADPALNLAVGDAASDQSQPKIVPTADGGCWISWFDGIGTGWDVRVQRLDVGGEEPLGHGGVLVADRGFSSTQDYGLDVDAAGNALLTYRDDSGHGTQISASKVAPDGTLLWGTTGVQLTSTMAFVAAPVIAATSDGGAVVGWTEGSKMLLRRLDAAGAFVGPEVEFLPPVGSYSASDMHAVGNDVIVSFVHQLGSFSSPRHLLAQKVDSAGTKLWGATHVSVFDGGSLQIGNFPDFETDGSGGAVFSWYSTSSFQLQCYVQRVLSGGAEAFPHNGVAVSTNASRVRTTPRASYDPSTGETFAYWIEHNSGQSQDGVYGQKFNAAGVRQWTNEGTVVLPVGTDDITSAPHVISGNQTMVVWDAASSFGNSRIFGRLVDGNGAMASAVFDVSLTPASKSRLALTRTAAGFGALAWADDRNDGGDIYAQNINTDATLGPRWTELLGGTAGIAGVPALSGSGPLAVGSELGLTLSSAPPGAFALLLLSFASTPLPFFGGTIHALPIALELPIVTNGSGGFAISAAFPAGIPPGTELVFQYLCKDSSNPYGKTISNAQKGTTP